MLQDVSRENTYEKSARTMVVIQIASVIRDKLPILYRGNGPGWM
jgi:hypothetical protein